MEKVKSGIHIPLTALVCNESKGRIWNQKAEERRVSKVNVQSREEIRNIKQLVMKVRS